MSTVIEQFVQWSAVHPTLAFAAKACVVFVITTVADVIWTLYIARTQQGRAVSAGTYSMCIVLLGAVNTIGYVHDVRLLIPAALGAWLGAYLAVTRESRLRRDEPPAPSVSSPSLSSPLSLLK